MVPLPRRSPRTAGDSPAAGRGPHRWASAERALADRPEPELAELSGAFDPHEFAREVALDLRRMYGDRPRAVLLFVTEAGPEARAGRGIAGRVTALSTSREEIAAARLLAEGGFGSRAISRA